MTKKQIVQQVGMHEHSGLTTDMIDVIAYYSFIIPAGLDSAAPKRVEWVLVRENFRAARPAYHVLRQINREEPTLEFSRAEHEKEEAMFHWKANLHRI